MSVDSKHPDYAARILDWEMMRTVSEGERKVKQMTETYLPKPSGFGAQKDKGVAMYNAYLRRAQFPEILSPTLRGMVGVIHRTDAQISGLEDGKPLSYMWEKCTLEGLTLDAFHRVITTEILLMGRFGILTDVPLDGGDPYFAGYHAESIINWVSKGKPVMFVLDESGQKLYDEFSWTDFTQHRVLRLTDGLYTNQQYDALAEGQKVEPKARGNGPPIDTIPFVVVGPREVSVAPDEPPMIGVARASLAIYRLDADYRHQLYNSGQETLFVFGGDAPTAVGAGVTVSLDKDGDARYVGPEGTGIAAHRTAIEDERQSAVAAGARLFDQPKQGIESGDAIRLRAAAQTATLTSIALASAAALERSLRHAAMFVGQDPNEIVVKPNLRFVDATMAPDAATKLVTVWQAGAISKQTLYENLQRGEIASNERTLEDEQALIDKEVIDNPIKQAPNAPPDPNNPPVGMMFDSATKTFVPDPNAPRPKNPVPAIVTKK